MYPYLVSDVLHDFAHEHDPALDSVVGLLIQQSILVGGHECGVNESEEEGTAHSRHCRVGPAVVDHFVQVATHYFQLDRNPTQKRERKS